MAGERVTRVSGEHVAATPFESDDYETLMPKGAADALLGSPGEHYDEAEAWFELDD